MRAPFAYRRAARECAVHALYLAEFAKMPIGKALEETFETFSDPEVHGQAPSGDEESDRFREFASLLARGAWRDRGALDDRIASAAPDYDVNRLAAIDKNVLRMATWELLELPYVPPAVTLNEAIEIAKKYSTAESGRFVNGVLGAILRGTPKVEWDPRAAPPDPVLDRPETVAKTPPPPIEEHVVEEGAPEAKIATRYGVWKLRAEADPPPD